jgi:hypothetical protein
MSRECVFCGGRGLTKEHVWPRWFRDAFGATFVGKHEQFSDGVLVRVYSGTLTDLTTRRVCGRCNADWMSDLEHTTRPMLIPLIKGEPIVLDAAQQQDVAFWCVKTALMTVQLHRLLRVPPEHYHDIYERRVRRELPSWMQVWIGAHQEATVAASYWSDHVTVTLTATTRDTPWICHGYGIGFSVGALVVHVFGHTATPASLTLRPTVDLAPCVVSLWPQQTPPCHWPPAYRMNDAERATFMRALRHALEHP